VASYNRIILVGNLTRDPQLSYTSANTAICKFGIATNEKWKDKDGNMKEEVCFVDCTAWGRQAEVFNQYMAKGRAVLVEGRLRLDQWTSPEGEKRSKHVVNVDRYTFLGGRGNDEMGRSGGSGGEYEPAHAAARPSAPPPSRMTHDEPRGPTDDDIPF
jgi:single-strand DNA-binding protein